MYLFYADVYFLMQAIEIHYALRGVEILCNRQRKWGKKVVTAGIVAGVETALACLCPYFWYTLLVHGALLPLAVLFCFYRRGEGIPGKEWLLCYLGTILFYGVSQWETYLFGRFTVVMEGITTAGLLGIFRFLAYKRQQSGGCYPISLTYGEVTLEGTGFLDSGNLLYDPVFKEPVSMAEEAWLAPILAIYEKPKYPVCYHTVSGGGVTEVIVADSLSLLKKGRWVRYDRPRIGILSGTTVRGGRCQLLLHKEHNKER